MKIFSRSVRAMDHAVSRVFMDDSDLRLRTLGATVGTLRNLIHPRPIGVRYCAGIEMLRNMTFCFFCWKRESHDIWNSRRSKAISESSRFCESIADRRRARFM